MIIKLGQLRIIKNAEKPFKPYSVENITIKSNNVSLSAEEEMIVCLKLPIVTNFTTFDQQEMYLNESVL